MLKIGECSCIKDFSWKQWSKRLNKISKRKCISRNGCTWNSLVVKYLTWFPGASMCTTQSPFIEKQLNENLQKYFQVGIEDHSSLENWMKYDYSFCLYLWFVMATWRLNYWFHNQAVMLFELMWSMWVCYLIIKKLHAWVIMKKENVYSVYK